MPVHRLMGRRQSIGGLTVSDHDEERKARAILRQSHRFRLLRPPWAPPVPRNATDDRDAIIATLSFPGEAGFKTQRADPKGRPVVRCS